MVGGGENWDAVILKPQGCQGAGRIFCDTVWGIPSDPLLRQEDGGEQRPFQKFQKLPQLLLDLSNSLSWEYWGTWLSSWTGSG